MLILAPKIIDILERLADDDPTVIDDIKRLEGTHVLVLADIERKLYAVRKTVVKEQIRLLKEFTG